MTRPDRLKEWHIVSLSTTKGVFAYMSIFVVSLQIQQKDEEIRDLHERNSHLMIQVDQLTEKASNSSGHSITLYNELSQLSGNQDVAMATDSPVNPVSTFLR